MLTAIALETMRKDLIARISSARFKVGSTWHDAQIQGAEILPDGRVAVTVLIDHTVEGKLTITEVQLCDRNGQIWASKKEKISRSAQEGILYRFRFTITEI